MKHSVSHTLDQALARKAAECAWQEYQEHYRNFSPTCTWVSETKAELGFSAKGVHVNGHIVLKPGEIAIDMKVPFLLRVFQKQAMQVIEAEIKKWVRRAEDGEL